MEVAKVFVTVFSQEDTTVDGAWMCERCGAEAPPDAQRCRRCGAWLPAYAEDDHPRPRRPWRRRIHLRTEEAHRPTTSAPREKTLYEETRHGATRLGETRYEEARHGRTQYERPRHETEHRPVPVGTLEGSGTVYGVARTVRMRTEVSGSDGDVGTTVVCNFRLEMRNREGRAIGLVPVEMRGDLFEGAVNDGDRVRATGRARNGTLRVKQLRNLTTGAEVSARSTPALVIAVVILLFVAWLVFIFAVTGR
ncbi:hypothetical protein [Streptomyces sp900129855]|uniref:Zinc ribbon domain-containing protein n=1 Tax=Streptomyces sp. 900129855 TaxID=3155129 RepID=A0ABV2ZL47_9ACTN